ncbi:PfkB family carbohydrate kinase [Oribacterium sp. NK2B42]|uniref:PfkB family carbohydrate kinase n=1 Tax=Oribacterium sp. NK2B42 TaxID=689781 RepID=UPI0004031E89|nr:PfkB family carbohydrate kinase [Oribacterium sp. NK2B42]
MSKNGIVVIGATFVDIKGYPTETFLQNGRNAGSVMQVHGGVCRNVAEDIANVELKPTFVSLVDDTGTGVDVINKLNRHKINTKYIRKVEDGLGMWLAIFNNDGDVIASISKRPDLGEIEDILKEQGDEIISEADSVVVEIDMDSSILKLVFDLAEKYGKEVYAVVSNMSIAMQRRDLIKRTGVLVCNEQEAGMLFSDDYCNKTPEEMMQILDKQIKLANYPRMVVTMGSKGAVYASMNDEAGFSPTISVEVIDTTGAGDAFFSGVAIGLTYGKSLNEACQIGSRLANSVILTTDNVCPRFLPGEFGIEAER